MPTITRSSVIALAAMLPVTSLAGDKLSIDVGGLVQYDLRFRVTPEEHGTWFNDLPDAGTLARNELLGRLKLGAKLGKFRMKSELDFVLRPYPKVESIDDLSLYNKVSPFRFEAQALYMEASDLIKNVDIRIGQQKALFGAGDQFNPTNTINANDFEDVLLFGDQIANLMVRIDWSPHWAWSLTGILIPIHKPAMLPRTAPIGLSAVDRQPFTDDELRWNLEAEAYTGEEFGFPTIARTVTPITPEISAENMQGFFRLGGSIGAQDVALSYYRGFSDIPQASTSYNSQIREEMCNPDDPEDCIDGLIVSDATLVYPRMHVLGLNMAGEFDLFGGVHKSFKPLGYRLEAAVIFPSAVEARIFQDDIQFLGGLVTREGEYPYPNEVPLTVDNRPFVKWVLGLDYTFNKHIYMNTQWVHGFPDEFGAGDFIQPGKAIRKSGALEGVQQIDCIDLATFSGAGETCAQEWYKPKLGDYLVMGLDFKFASSSGLFRLFTIWDLIGVYEEHFDEAAGERVLTHHNMFTKEGFAGVIFPSFAWNFGNGLQLEAGGLIQLGQDWSKFGDPAAGGSLVWTRARYQF